MAQNIQDSIEGNENNQDASPLANSLLQAQTLLTLINNAKHVIGDVGEFFLLHNASNVKSLHQLTEVIYNTLTQICANPIFSPEALIPLITVRQQIEQERILVNQWITYINDQEAGVAGHNAMLLSLVHSSINLLTNSNPQGADDGSDSLPSLDDEGAASNASHGFH